jgi:AmmeMemoRadiSam system protein B/AmmeMemoRadiSam system protein A
MEKKQKKVQSYNFVKSLKTSLFLFSAFLIFSGISSDFSYCRQLNHIKTPDFSGIFYPSDKKKLISLLNDFFAKSSKKNTPGRVYGMICPHAGYVYSGKIAAKNYKQVMDENYNTVVILCSSHHYILKKTAVYPDGGFRTPLGFLEVDKRFADDLLEDNPETIESNRSAFKQEHAIEVQLPFIQTALGKAKIVPLVIPSNSFKICQKIASGLEKLIKERSDVLVIASSDLSHFHDKYYAEKIDRRTLSLILNSDPRKLFECVQKGENEMCGSSAVATLMLLMESLSVNNIEVVDYATSADSDLIPKPDNSRVVGYASILFKKEEFMLSLNQKKQLLNVARKAITDYLKDKQKNPVTTEDKMLLEHRGAFVTINKNNALRGCIGLITAEKPLIEVVYEMAIQAAVGDPRFPDLKTSELKDIELEISVLSPLEEIEDVSRIQVGTHGLLIRKGFHSGLLLPQVATEYNWDKQEFLEHTCLKAGLSADDWKKGAQIYIFQAQVFNEQEI